MLKNNSKSVNNEENNIFNGNDSIGDSASTAIISRDSNESNKSNNINNVKNCFKKCTEGFLGGKNIPDEKKIYNHQDNDVLLSLQIKYALNKMGYQYSINKKTSDNSLYFNKFCEYYLGNYYNDTSPIKNNEIQNNFNNFNNRYK